MKNLGSPLPAAGGGTGVATASDGQVFAGPASGSAAAPCFRALVPADDPAPADGCCRISVASTTTALLSPFMGNTLVFGTTACTIPSGGITSPALPSPGNFTRLYLYAQQTSGVVTSLAWSTTGYLFDGYGRAYKSNGASTPAADGVNRLVGKGITNGSGQLAASTANPGVVNYFWRRDLPLSIGISGTPQTTSTSMVPATNPVYFETWADEASVTLAVAASGHTSQAGGFSTCGLIDGAQATATATSYCQASGQGGNDSISQIVAPAAEAVHTAAMGFNAGYTSGCNAYIDSGALSLTFRG